MYYTSLHEILGTDDEILTTVLRSTELLPVQCSEEYNGEGISFFF